MTSRQEDCFVIMPISDPDDYVKGHFKHVYDDIITPACEKSGYRAIRADDVLETNMIHLDVLKKLLDTPMAVCDLSTRNPNVLFELGLRQAFDKPVVLIQEKNTPKIFDIAPLRFTEYRKERIYHQVIEDQDNIALSIEATKNAIGKGDGINSIVKLLSLTTSASYKEIQKNENNPMLQMIMAEMDAMRQEFVRALRSIDRKFYGVNIEDELKQINDLRNMLDRAEHLMSGSKNPRRIREVALLCSKIETVCIPILRSENPMIRKEARDLNEKSRALLALVVSNKEKVVKDDESNPN